MEDIGDAVENPVALRFVTPFTEVTGLVAYMLHIFRKIKIKNSHAIGIFLNQVYQHSICMIWNPLIYNVYLDVGKGTAFPTGCVGLPFPICTEK